LSSKREKGGAKTPPCLRSIRQNSFRNRSSGRFLFGFVHVLLKPFGFFVETLLQSLFGATDFLIVFLLFFCRSFLQFLFALRGFLRFLGEQRLQRFHVLFMCVV